MPKIYIGADHRGFKLKEKIKAYINAQGYEIIDMGNVKYDEDDDYPDYAKKVAEKVSQENARGILLCGSGQGVCITANKYDGVRAAVGINKDQIQSSTADEDVNVLCLAADYVTEKQTKEIVEAWLNTKFSGKERHVRRVNKIKEIERNN